MRSFHGSAVLSSILLALTACIGDDPAVMGALLLQPRATVSVFDTSGLAIADAEVFVLTKAENHSLWNGQANADRAKTDRFGSANFWRRYEMFGTTGYKLKDPPVFVWAICIQKAGYVTYRQVIGRASDISVEPAPIIKQIRLKAGKSTPCPLRNGDASF